MDDIEQGKPKSTGKIYWFISLAVFILLLPGSLLLALFGLASLNDSYSHDADMLWGVLSAAEAALLILGSLASLAYLITRNQVIGKVAILFLVLSILGCFCDIAAGVQMFNASQHRGGDWAGFAVVGNLLFGILFPAVLGLLAAGGGACILVLYSKNQLQPPAKLDGV